MRHKMTGTMKKKIKRNEHLGEFSSWRGVRGVRKEENKERTPPYFVLLKYVDGAGCFLSLVAWTVRGEKTNKLPLGAPRKIQSKACVAPNKRGPSKRAYLCCPKWHIWGSLLGFLRAADPKHPSDPQPSLLQLFYPSTARMSISSYYDSLLPPRYTAAINYTFYFLMTNLAITSFYLFITHGLS